jgi:hypothetical protein
MQQKLCLWLCPSVLLLALCIGNPFVGARDARALRVPSQPRDIPAAAPATPATAAAPATLPKATPVDLRAPAAGAGFQKALAGAALQPANAVALRGVPTPALGLACPDPTLAPLVVDTDLTDHGQVVWVLRDGRRLCRNPHGTQPLLVPAASVSRR